MEEEAQKSTHQCPNTEPCPLRHRGLAKLQGRAPWLSLLKEAPSRTHATDRPTLQRNWEPRFPVVELGTPRRHKGGM